MKQLALTLAGLGLLAATSQASVGSTLRYYVNGNNGSSGNGLSWNTSFRYLQDALDEVETTLLGGCGCDIEVFVAHGTYRPDESLSNPGGNNDRFASFELLDEVTIYGHFAGFETSASERDLLDPTYETILSGEIGGSSASDNSYHVVDASFTNDVPTNAILDGFTITGGHANGTGDRERGGGLYADFGRANVFNCTFEGNYANLGGAVASEGGANLVFSSCRVRDNEAVGGGGAHLTGSFQTWIQSTFHDNSASLGGAVLSNDGQGNTVLTLKHVTMAGNSSSQPGDDIYTVGGGTFNDLDITNSIFWSDEPWRLDDGTFVQADYLVLRGGVGGVSLSGSVTLNTSNVIVADPQLRDAASGDLRIATSSPAAGAGDPGAIQLDLGDIDGDGNRNELLPLDLGRNDRTVDVLDIGAHEALCETSSYCVSVLNSSGGAAKIAMFGDCSVSARDLTLRAAPVPNTPGIFYFGTNQVQTVFGNGLRCAGGVTKRLPFRTANGNVLSYTLNWNGPQAAFLLPGSAWNFQAWFRDPAAGGALFNTSDAVEVHFEN